MERIKRCLDIEFRSSEEDDRTIEGYASVFDQETDIGWFFEKIDRHAFDECDMSNVYLLMNHDDNIVLAGTPNNSLELSVDDKGLRVKAKVVETSQGNDYLKLVKEGLIRKMSFGFTIDRDHGCEWYEDSEGKDHRTILKINKLYDASIVTFPAYEGTSVRSMELDEEAKNHLEERKVNKEKELRSEETTEVIEEVVEEVNEEVEANAETNEVVEETIVEENHEEKSQDVQMEERKMNTNFEKVDVRAEEVKLESTDSYIKAWRKSVMGDNAELRTLTSAMDNAPIPTVLQAKIETAWEKATNILDRTHIVSVKGNIEVPFEKDADEAVVHDENTEAPTEETLELGMVDIKITAIKKWLEYTDILEAMTDDEFMEYLADEIIYRVFKKTNDAVVVGALDSANRGHKGIVNADLTLKKEIALGFNAFNEADAELKDNVNSVIVMNKKTFKKNILGLTDLQGRPIYTQMTDINGVTRDYVSGMEVLFCNALKDYDSALAGEAWAIVGDLYAYETNMPNGKRVETIKDRISKFTEDKIVMAGKLLSGGNVTRLDSLIVLKKPQA